VTLTLAPTDGSRYGTGIDILTDGKALIHNDFKVQPGVGDVIGLAPHPEPYDATSKTIHMPDQDLVATDGTCLASLTAMSTTVTQVADPHDGSVSLFITFRYLVSANGYRTGYGPPTEPLGVPHGLHFMNAAGGIVYSWRALTENFALQWGWTDHQGYYVMRESDYVSWFADWRKVRYRMEEGTFWSC
jgi:hypothetical protein